jgi:hypothetical protein
MPDRYDGGLLRSANENLVYLIKPMSHGPKKYWRYQNSIDNSVLSNKDIAKNQLEQIVYQCSPIRNIIIDAFKHKRIPKEYLFSSILFAYSNAAGLAFRLMPWATLIIQTLQLYSRGDIKSPAMDLATQPLHDYDNTNYNEHKTNKLTTPVVKQ